MVFKKDLTPLSKKGTVTKHKGKGATEQRVPFGARSAVPGPLSLDRATNRYPKVAPPMPGPILPEE